MQQDTPRTGSEESGYAELRIQKSSIKWFVIFAVVLFVVFLGLLLASVIISSSITRDVQVKDGQLVSAKDQRSVIKTSEGLYTQRVNLDTPYEVIQNVRSITVNEVRLASNSAAQAGTFQFQVTGFERIPGRKLVFHGHTHSASIKADGSVEIIQNFASNNKRNVEVRYGNSAEIRTALWRDNNANIKSITHCDNLTALDEAGLYRLENDLTCTLSQPLPVFKGLLNGNKKRLTITMYRPNGEVALFQSLRRGGIFNLILAGTFTGKGRCAGFSVQARSGTALISNKFFGSVVCSAPSSGLYAAAPFVAELKPNEETTKNITLQYLLSAGTVTTDVGATPWIGGVFGCAPNDLNVVTRYNWFFTRFPNMNTPDMSHFAILGNYLVGGKKRGEWDDACGNPNHPYYNNYCWQNFNYYSNGTSNPSDDWWECCSEWEPCSGCVFWIPPWECQMDLCIFGGGDGKRSEGRRWATDAQLAAVINFIPVPVIDQPVTQ